MKNGTPTLVSLVAVVTVSIVFGMLIGGRLNAPPVAMAAPRADSGPVRLAPAAMLGSSLPDFADVVENSLPAVVSVSSIAAEQEESADPPSREELWFRFFEPEQFEQRGRPTPREGSGFIISEDGYILTNHHVVENAEKVKVGFQNGREIPARVIGTDRSIDLALLKVETAGDRMPTLALGDSDHLRVGQWVIAIGNPLEYEHTVTVGVVSAKMRRVPIGSTDGGVASFIQTDAAINFGNSGGPLLDGHGNVIGINTAIRRRDYAEGIGFALPINHARNVIEQLRTHGYVRRGYIGITMNRDGIDEIAREYYDLPDTRGVIIEDVNPEGPAAVAGLRKDDVIRRVDGQEVRDNGDLIAKIASHQPGDRVELEVFRSGRLMQVRAVLTDREEGLQNTGNRPAPVRPEMDREIESTGLGFTVRGLSAESRRRLGLDAEQGGVLVTDVDFGSEAASKAIVPGIVITAINGLSIDGVGDWEERVDDLEPGTPVKLTLMQGDRESSVYLRVPE